MITNHKYKPKPRLFSSLPYIGRETKLQVTSYKYKQDVRLRSIIKV